MKVLICSPEADQVRLLQIVFHEDGAEVETCTSLDQAGDLVMFSPTTPQAVVLNPWQDGALAYLRQVMNVFWNYRVVVVFITDRVVPDELKDLELLKPDLLVNTLGKINRSFPACVRDLVELEALHNQAAS